MIVIVGPQPVLPIGVVQVQEDDDPNANKGQDGELVALGVWVGGGRAAVVPQTHGHQEGKAGKRAPVECSPAAYTGGRVEAFNVAPQVPQPIKNVFLVLIYFSFGSLLF